MSPDQKTVPHQDSMAVLRTIAVVKALETIALIAAGLAALQLLDPTVVNWLNTWASTLPAANEQHIAQHVLGWLGDFQPKEIKQLGLGAFALAAIYTVEGVGLWLGRRWAEWFSIVATALFIPLEVSELLHKPTLTKLATLGLNLLVVGYLLVRIRRHPKHRT